MLGEALSLACAAVWGLSVVLFKRSEAVSARGINLFKNVVGTLLLAALMLILRDRVDLGRTLEDWLRLSVSGVIGLAVADTLFLAALQRLGAGLVSILDCAYAPLVVLFSMLLLGEELGLHFLIGAPLVLGGIAIVSVEWSAVRTAAKGARIRGVDVALCLLSIAFMAIAIVIAKPALERGGVVETTWIRLVAGTVALAAWVATRPDRAVTLSAFRPQRAWRALVPASILGTFVSMLLWIGGMKYAPASTAAVLNQLSVFFTLVFARLWLGEALTPRRLVGGGVSLAGTIIILLP